MQKNNYFYQNYIINKEDLNIFFNLLKQITPILDQKIVYGTGGGSYAFEKEI